MMALLIHELVRKVDIGLSRAVFSYVRLVMVRNIVLMMSLNLDATYLWFRWLYVSMNFWSEIAVDEF